MNEEFAISLKTILDNSSISDVKGKLDKLKEEIENKFGKVKVSINSEKTSSPTKNAISEIEKYEQAIKEASERVRQLEEAKAKVEAGGHQFKDELLEDANKNLSELIKKYLSLLNAKKLVNNEETNTQTPQQPQNNEPNNDNGNSEKEKNNELSKMQQLLERIKSLWDSIGNAVKNVASKIASGATNIFKWSLGLKDGNNKMDSLVKNAKKFVLSLVGARSIFTGIRKAMSSYLSQNEELKNKLDACWYALGSLFAPILEKVVQTFVYLVSLVNQLVKFLGFAGIKMDNYGKSAGKASKQLAGFDEINNLNKDEGGSSAQNPFGDFEANIPDTSSFSKWLDEMISKLPNFSEVLGKIGDKINDFSKYLYDMLTYVDEYGRNIKDKVIELSAGIADAFNGLVNKINWGQLGDAFGAGLDLIITAITSFIDEFNFENLGSSLAIGFNHLIEQIDFENVGKLLVARFNIIWETLEGFFSTIDWNLLSSKVTQGIQSIFDNINLSAAATAISDAVSGLIKILNDALTNIDFKETGIKIGNAIRDIDWYGILTGVVDAIINAANGLVDLAVGAVKSGAIFDICTGIGGALIDGLTKVFTDLIPDLLELGVNLIGGLLQGILGALVGIGEWLALNVVGPIVNSIKNLFGIHSPSTVFAEIGTSLVEGLFSTLSTLWERVKGIFESFKQNIQNTFETIKTSVINIVSNIKTSIANAWNTIKTNTTNTFNNIKTSLLNIWNSIWTGIKNFLNKIIGGVENMVNKCIDGINNGIIGKLMELGSGLLGIFGLDVPNKLSHISLPRLDTGTNYVPNDMVAMIHQGEAVIPKEFNSEQYFNNEETNALLEQLIRKVDAIELNPYITVKDVGQASIKYINSQSRILGTSLV